MKRRKRRKIFGFGGWGIFIKEKSENLKGKRWLMEMNVGLLLFGSLK